MTTDLPLRQSPHKMGSVDFKMWGTIKLYIKNKRYVAVELFRGDLI